MEVKHLQQINLSHLHVLIVGKWVSQNQHCKNMWHQNTVILRLKWWVLYYYIKFFHSWKTWRKFLVFSRHDGIHFRAPYKSFSPLGIQRYFRAKRMQLFSFFLLYKTGGLIMWVKTSNGLRKDDLASFIHYILRNFKNFCFYFDRCAQFVQPYRVETLTMWQMTLQPTWH